MCNRDYVKTPYKIKNLDVCQECYAKHKCLVNEYKRSELSRNTFIVRKYGEDFTGIITGYQHKKGSQDKFYLHMNANKDGFSIWFDNWMTESEIAISVDKWNICIEDLLQ